MIFGPGAHLHVSTVRQTAPNRELAVRTFSTESREASLRAALAGRPRPASIPGVRRGRCVVKRGNDSIDSGIGILVFPDPDDTPSGVLELLGVLVISGPIAFQLGLPVGSVLPTWDAPVVRAEMLAAPIYKDCKLGPRERDVRPDATTVEFDGVVLTEAQTRSVQCGPQGDLRLGVCTTVFLHHC